MKTRCIDLSSKKYKVYFYIINGKTYYGLTSRPLTKRHTEHLKEVKSGTGKSKLYKEWRNDLNPNSIKIQLYKKDLSPIQAGLLESFLIFQDKTQKYGLNSTAGGELNGDNHIKHFARCDDVQEIWGDNAFYYYDIHRVKNLDVKQKVEKAKGEVIKLPPQRIPDYKTFKTVPTLTLNQMWQKFSPKEKLKIKKWKRRHKREKVAHERQEKANQKRQKRLKLQRMFPGATKKEIRTIEKRIQKHQKKPIVSLYGKYQWNPETVKSVNNAPSHLQEKLKQLFDKAKDPALVDKDIIRSTILNKYYNLLHDIQDTY